MGGVSIEQGDAVLQADGLYWIYTATQLNANPSVEVYPNPTAGELFVGELPQSGVCSFELLDTSGAVVSKCNVDANNNSVSLARLAKGLYLYRLTSNGKLLKAGKVVKN